MNERRASHGKRHGRKLRSIIRTIIAFDPGWSEENYQSVGEEMDGAVIRIALKVLFKVSENRELLCDLEDDLYDLMETPVKKTIHLELQGKNLTEESKELVGSAIRNGVLEITAPLVEEEMSRKPKYIC